MRVFVDTNVLLDVLDKRMPFHHAAARIWTLVERGTVQGFVSALSFNNVYYIVRKAEGRAKASRSLRLIRNVFEPVAPDRMILDQALDAALDDFEDAVQFHSAVRAGADYLVTRNPDHFPKGALPILSPEEFLALLERQTALPPGESAG